MLRRFFAALLLVAASASEWPARAQIAATPTASNPAGPATAASSAGPAAPAEQPRALDPIVVTGTRYKNPFPDAPPFLFRWNPTLGPFKLPGPFDYTTLGAMIVTATRSPQPPERVAATVKLFDETALRTAPTATLDGMLRSLPGFSLFRRTDSFSANPTAQGVSLRGLGPSGASRSLILLDGVPLNDPFGGWVAWTKVPRDGLARAELVPGGGATAWGNAALGGVVQLFTQRARGHPLVVKRPATGRGSQGTEEFAWGTVGDARVTATIGDFSTRSIEFAVNQPTADGAMQLLGRTFATDGYSLVAPERRGPIDIDAWSRHRWVAARWREVLGGKLEFTGTVRGFEESRGNGTPYTRNSSREKFLSLALAGQPGDNFAWNTVAYAQDQSFACTFSSVNATRTAETPASDQYAVPATAAGAAWTGAWKHAGGGRTSAGADLRYVQGETRENFTFTNGGFTRRRIAGGTQTVGGLFALHEQPLGETLRGTIGGRLDRWREADGHRRENDRTTGAVLRDDHYADSNGIEFSPSAGMVWTPDQNWRLRGNAQQAFRRPTLNELYRPFRQGANITETNPALRTERNTSGEVGAEWTLFRTRPRPANIPATARYEPKPFAALTLSATAFWNDLRDAVGNVTLARGPGTFPLFGTIAAGGVGRQRLNLDRIRVQGVELSASWKPARELTFTVDTLYNDASVRRASVAPGPALSSSNGLVGNRVAQVPRQSVTFGAAWHAPGGITLTPRVRWIGRQFEDDENLLRLGEVVVVDLGLSRALTKHVEFFLNAENLGNARIETGRSADGVVNTGTPRFLFGGVRGKW